MDIYILDIYKYIYVIHSTYIYVYMYVYIYIPYIYMVIYKDYYLFTSLHQVLIAARGVHRVSSCGKWA